MKLTDVTDSLGITNTRAQAPIDPSMPYKDVEDLGERKELYSWTTTNIPSGEAFKLPKVNRSFVVIGIFLLVLFLVMKEFLLIAALGSLFFLWNVLSGVKSEPVSHQITTHGINYAGQFFKWTELKEFFFAKMGNADTLNINTIQRLPGRLILLINPQDKDRLSEILSKYLTYVQKEPNNVFDRVYETVIDKVSLDGE